jgi:hypothetical protein
MALYKGSEETPPLPLSSTESVGNLSSTETAANLTNSERSTDPGPVSGAFSSVSGVLGGFCITIVVLALTPNVIEHPKGRDLIAATLLAAAAIYIASAGILANAQNTLFLTHQIRRGAFITGIVLFHVANMVLSLGLVFIAFQFQLPATKVVSIIICAFATLVALANILGAMFGRPSVHAHSLKQIYSGLKPETRPPQE